MYLCLFVIVIYKYAYMSIICLLYTKYMLCYAYFLYIICPLYITECLCKFMFISICFIISLYMYDVMSFCFCWIRNTLESNCAEHGGAESVETIGP